MERTKEEKSKVNRNHEVTVVRYHCWLAFWRPLWVLERAGQLHLVNCNYEKLKIPKC